MTHDPLSTDLDGHVGHRPVPVIYVNQISRTISIAFGVRPPKHATFYCDNFRDIQLWVATCRLPVQQMCRREAIIITCKSWVVGQVGHGSVHWRVRWVMGHVGHGSVHWRVRWVVGHVGHRSVHWWFRWVMGHVGHGSVHWWVRRVMGQVGHGLGGSWVSSLMGQMGQMDHGS